MLTRIITLIGLSIFAGNNLFSQDAPTIVIQPANSAIVLHDGVSQGLNQNVPEGSIILFDSGAQGENLSYQWTLNGDPIPEATNSFLNLTNVSVVMGGSYAVTVWNDGGTAQSQRAVVKIECPSINMTDNFADASVITNMSGAGRDDYWQPTREEGEPEHADVSDIQSKWITWIAPTNGVATIQTFGSSFDTVLAVYTGDTVSNLVEIACDGDLWGHQGCYVMFNMQAGVQYRIAVGGFMKSSIENLVLTWKLSPTVYPLPEILQQSHSQTLAEGDSATLSVDYTSDASVSIQWYLDGCAVSNANQATFNLPYLTEADLGVYYVSLSSSEWTYFLKPIEIQFNSEGATSAAARHKLNVSSNSPLGGNDEETNSLNKLAPMGIKPPSFSGYQGTQLFHTYPGKDPDEPNICGVVGGSSYWFSYVPPENGTLYLDTIGSSFDTLLGLFIDDGSNRGYASLIQIACDDNSGNGTKTSALHAPVNKGNTYFIMIDGKKGSTGNVTLHYLLDRKPVISSISNQTVNEEQSTGVIGFSVNDMETAAESLQLSASSSDQSLAPNSSIVFGGSGSSRTVTVTPTPYHFGTCTISINITDTAGNTSSTSFTLQVLAINHMPTISTIGTQTINEEQSTPAINFTIGDYETLPENLQLSATSSDQTLVPNSSIAFGGSGTNRTITVTPTPYHYGTNSITVFVTDAGGLTASCSFTLQVCKINHAPVATTDSYTRLPNNSIMVSYNAVLRNDSDIDGDALTVISVASYSQLGYPILKNQSYMIYPVVAGSTPDRFSYTVSDGHGGTATGYVYIFVGSNGQTIIY